MYDPAFFFRRSLFQDFRLEVDLAGFKQQNDGGTGQLKVSLFTAFDEPGVFFFIENTADDQGADFTLHHRAEMLCGQQAPATLVQHIDRILLAGNGLNTVQNTGNVVVFSLYPSSM